jgi:hypothetical protein
VSAPIVIACNPDTFTITASAEAIGRLRALVDSYGLPIAAIDFYLVFCGLARLDDNDACGRVYSTQAGAALVTLHKAATKGLTS